MCNTIKFYLLIIVLGLFINPVKSQVRSTGNILFDDNWKFQLGGSLGVQNPEYNDTFWRNIQLPHDWSIEDIENTRSPFDRFAIGQASTGFTRGGVGWYRKTFTIDQSLKSMVFSLRFEGVYNVAEVYVNGSKVGTHYHGYTGFSFDISSFIKVNASNVVAVKVTNYGENSRWYSGSGIYRHVWLEVNHPIYFRPESIVITTPVVSPNNAQVKLVGSIQNRGNPAKTGLIRTQIYYEGQEISTQTTTVSLSKDKSVDFQQGFNLVKASLWSVDSPNLYRAVSTLIVNNEVIDSSVVNFGIRSIAFDTQNGFRLNGQSLKLKGGCVHHDNGPLGAKAYDRAEVRRVQLLKNSGYNAVRSAHNPPSRAFLDACDSIGLLVIDEAFDMWNIGKNPNDYHLYFADNWKKDLESMLFRDRNHPSVIMWSIGNEIPEMETPEVVEWAKKLAAHCREIDPTRPVTAAVHQVNDNKDAMFGALDISGYNYAYENYNADTGRKPDRVIVATESSPFLAFDYWMGVEDYRAVIGDFVWTAFDYIGEASIGWRGFWVDEHLFPWSLAYCGDIDICGWKRPQSYYRDVLWESGKKVALFVKPPVPSFPFNEKKEAWSNWHWQDVLPDWTWPGYENQSFEVEVYSQCDEVELFSNAVSLGRKATNRETKFTARWELVYQPGSLKAVGYNKMKKVAEDELITAGVPAEIKLTADRKSIAADAQDLSYVTVELLDKQGNRNPKAEQLISFEVEGPGEIIAVGNGNPNSLESYIQPERKAWQGRCLVIVKSSGKEGEIFLKATSNGLQSDALKIVASTNLNKIK
jgi:beta-galactosidase